MKYMKYKNTVEWFNKEIEKHVGYIAQSQPFAPITPPQKFKMHVVECENQSLNEVEVGDIVCVTKSDLQSYNHIGVVIGITGPSSNYATVQFEDWNNQGPKELTFCIRHLELKEKGENNMAVTGNYDIAIVKFIQGYDTSKEYAFALFNVINPGKFVLCDTKNGYQVGQIIRIEKKAVFNGALPTAEIICQVDFSDFEARKAARAERKRLKKEMDRLIAEDRELVLYQALAEKSPAMAELLNAYKELDGIG